MKANIFILLFFVGLSFSAFSQANRYTMIDEPSTMDERIINKKEGVGSRTIDSNFYIGYYKVIIPKKFEQYYYITPKQNIPTKNNFYLKAIGLFRFTDWRHKNRRIYALRSIDPYTNKNNKSVWTYCVFEFNPHSRHLIKFKEKGFKEEPDKRGTASEILSIKNNFLKMLSNL